MALLFLSFLESADSGAVCNPKFCTLRQKKPLNDTYIRSTASLIGSLAERYWDAGKYVVAYNLLLEMPV